MSKVILREKILAIGAPGSGKSYSGLTIARCFPDNRFFIMDSDDAVPRMLATDFADLNNVTILPCVEWPDYEKAVKTVEKDSKPGDWLMIDLITQAWAAVQNYFVETIYAESLSELLMRMRAAMKAGDTRLKTLEGWNDWRPIKALYNDNLMRRIKYKISAHVYATASVRAPRDSDERDIKEMFAGGKMPEGEKHLGHEFFTILNAQHLRDGWTMSTIKDIGRKLMDRQPMPNFGLGYVIAVAGLKPKKAKKKKDKKEGTSD